MSKRFALLLAGILATGFSLDAAAENSASDRTMASIYYGRGADTNGYGLQGLWRWPCECAWLTQHGLEPLIGVNVAYWDGQQPDNPYPHLWDFGAHGYLRYFWHPNTSFDPMVEVGLGIHALTEQHLNTNRDFGTWFQFGSRIGAGFAFNTPRRVEVVAFIEHISNAKLAQPNDGITFRGIEIRVAFP